MKGEQTVSTEQLKNEDLTEAAQQALEACPFCGGKPLAYDMRESLSICTVECSGCDITVEGRTTEAAATKWNTRASLPAPQQATPAQEVHPLASRCYAMSEPHLSGYRLVLGFETLEAVDAAHTWVANVRKAPQQATPEPVLRFCPGCGSVGDVPDTYRDCCPDGANARLIPASLAHRCHDLFRLALDAATPEPVGEPVAWLRASELADLRDCQYMLLGADSPKIWAPNDISAPTPDMGLVPVYHRPAPGVPEVDPLQGAVNWLCEARLDISVDLIQQKLHIGYNRASRLLAAAQAKGGEHG